MAYLLVNKIIFYLWLAANIHRSFILSNVSIHCPGGEIVPALWLSHCPVDLTLVVMGSNFSEYVQRERFKGIQNVNVFRSYLNHQIRLSKFNGATVVSPPKRNRGGDRASNCPKNGRYLVCLTLVRAGVGVRRCISVSFSKMASELLEGTR